MILFMSLFQGFIVVVRAANCSEERQQGTQNAFNSQTRHDDVVVVSLLSKHAQEIRITRPISTTSVIFFELHCIEFEEKNETSSFPSSKGITRKY